MDDSLIDISDLLFVPLYFILLYAGLLYIRKRNAADPLVRKYLMKGFVARIAGAIFCGMLIYFYYGGVGDTLSYFRDSMQLRQLVSEGKISLSDFFFKDYSYFQDTFDMQHSSAQSGFVVTKFAFIFSYPGLNRFLPTTMIMATVSYFGIFKLFQTFVALAPIGQKMIAFFVLFFPSLCIYGSPILKDTICLSCLGMFYYAMYTIIEKKNFRLQYFLMIIFSMYFIYAVKVYIIAAFVACYILYFITKIIAGIQNPLFKVAAFPMLIVLTVTLYVTNASRIDDALGAYSVEKIQESMEGLRKSYNNMSADDVGSNFDIGAIEPSFSGILKKIPVGISATLYRPFVWEVRKPIIAFSALESLFIVLFTLYVLGSSGFVFFFKELLSNPTVLLFISFSLLFSGLVGLSTLNFGTLTRYRIPAIPFYLMGLLMVLIKGRQHKAALHSAAGKPITAS